MTEPALAHWLDEHRHSLTTRIFHLMYVLQTLGDHDRHTLDAIVAERRAIAQAAQQVLDHSAHTDLAGTHLLAPYQHLAQDQGAYWPQWYAERGAEALRTATIEHLEQLAHDLTRPPDARERYGGPGDGDVNYDLRAYPAEHLLAQLHQLREHLAALRQHPHDAEHRAAAEPLLADLTTLANHECEVMRHLIDPAEQIRLGISRVKGLRGPVWAISGHDAYATITHALAGASLDNLAALEDVTWRATAALNNWLGR